MTDHIEVVGERGDIEVVGERGDIEVVGERGDIVVVGGRAGVPYGATVLAEARANSRAVLIVGLPIGDLTVAARIEALLGEEYGIGAVLPEVPSDMASLAPSRDDPVGPSRQLAVRASSVLKWPPDPTSNKPGEVAGALLNAVRSSGLRVVREPTWTVEEPYTSTHSEDKALDERLGVLVVAGVIGGGTLSDEDRALRQLVDSLSAQCRDCKLTVLSIDPRSPAAAADFYRSRGIAVLGFGNDWQDRLIATAYQYSHVFMTEAVVRSNVLHMIEETQPQATKVMAFSSLPFRRISGLGPITPNNEKDGLLFERTQAEAALLAELRRVDMVWCERERDTAAVAGLLPEIPVVLIPPAVEVVPRVNPDAARRGLVLMATHGYDVESGNEEAALFALEHVIPTLQRRGVKVECTLVTDWPSPVLEVAAAKCDTKLVGSDSASSALAQARMALITHYFGSGGGAIVHAALGAGTPFITTPQAVDQLSLGPLAPLAVRGTLEDVVESTRRLLTDDDAWAGFAKTAAEVVAGRFSDEARAVALRAVLPGLGIVPSRSNPKWPQGEAADGIRRALRPVGVDLRPEGTPAVLPLVGPEPTDPGDRYRLWCVRRGPNAQVLAAIAEDVRHAPIRPLISVVMPVYNTDAVVLEETLDSVRAQVYDNWQLCIADDGSTRDETLAVLRDAELDSRVVVSRLPGQSGISNATNAALALAEGDWITFLDHDDLLKAHALAQVVRWINADPALDVIYSDEDKLDERGRLVDPHIKPDWSPDQLMSQNYVSHLTVARRSLIQEVGGLREEFDGSQDYDLVLRLTEQTNHIAHIPEPLYTWRMVPGSTAAVATAKPYALEAARRALDAALDRRGAAGQAEDTQWTGLQRTRYDLVTKPSVTIIIPTKNGIHLLRRCVDSVLERSTYTNFEILVIDNQSTDGETLEYLAEFPGRVIHYPYRFNYARMMNLGARAATGDVLLFLNNDTEVITPDWIEALLEHAMRPEVGAVGGRLYFGNGNIQHEGILVGVWGGWAANIDHGGFWHRGDMIRNVSAVTGACTMMRAGVYRDIGGNDERLRVAYNDVDICLRIRQSGLHVVYTPYAELYHYESATRSGFEHHEDGPWFGTRWRPKELIDPFFSPLFKREHPFEIAV